MFPIILLLNDPNGLIIIMLYKVVLTSESAHQTLKHGHQIKSIQLYFSRLF